MELLKKSLSTMLIPAILFVIPMEASAFTWSPNTINVGNNRGGQIIEYAVRVKKIARTGKLVKFSGYCDSSCTLYLSLPRSQICITEGAKFRFHLPYGSSTRGNRHAANYLRKSYPSWVRNWIRNNGGLSHQLKTMDYRYASQFLPTCKTRTTKSWKRLFQV